MTEPARAELRYAAIAFCELFDQENDHDSYVNAITRLEAAAKAFADSELVKDKARLDWLQKQEGLTTCGFSFNWFYDYTESLREAIDSKMETPPSNHLDGAT